MANKLSELLEARPWLLADGATGTNLFAAGLETGDAPELWNLEQEDKILALHQGFIASGSDLILTNSFGGTAHRLKLHGAEGQVHALNKRAAELARQAADAADRPIIVAGSMGPTGELLEPNGPLSFEDAVTAFEDQAKGLLEGGVDVLWAETISSEEEIRAAAQAAANLDAPFCGTLSFDSSGRTMMGVTSTQYSEMAAGLPATPIAFGANCGVGASDLLRTVLGLRAAAPEAILIAKANAGVPKWLDGQIVYDGTPELMAAYAVLARRCGARIIGGCCGTTGGHLTAMRSALEASEDGAAPSLEEIVEALGPFSSESDGTGVDPHAAPARPRRGRRRS